MYVKRILKFHFLKRKEQGLTYNLPFAVLFVFLPLMIVDLSKEAAVFYIKAYEGALEVTQAVIPILSVYWLIFQLDERFDKKKKELYKSVKRNSSYIAIYYSIYFALLLLPLYFFIAWRIPGFFYEYFRIVCICIFFQGGILATLFSTKSKWFAVLFGFLYTVFSVENSGKSLSYIVGLPMSRAVDYSRVVTFLVIGLIVWGIVNISEQK